MPKKTPLRKITSLGLDQLLGQIVAQAAGSAGGPSYPPTGITTAPSVVPSAPPATPIPGRGPTPTPVYQGGPADPPAATPSPMLSAPQRPTNQPIGVDANGNYVYAGDYPMDKAQPGYTPPQPTGRDANGDYVYAQDKINTTQTATPAPGPMAGPRPMSPYRNVGEIFAESPESDDPATILQFNKDRLTKLGQFYGLDPQAITEAQATAAGMLGMASSNPGGITPVETKSLVNQIYQSVGDRIIKENDQGAYDLANAGPGGTTTPMFEGSASSEPATVNNPLSAYGVYTPEQIAAIQGQIGQYVNAAQDRFSSAAGGWRPSAEMMDAYHRQAQAIPAVQALEGQHRLAQELADAKDQIRYYQMMAQMPQGGSSSSSSGMSDEDMASFVDSLVNGGK